MYRLCFQKIWLPIRVFIAIDKNKEGKFNSFLYYYVDEEAFDCSKEDFLGESLDESLKKLCIYAHSQYQSSNIRSKDGSLLSECAYDLCEKIKEIHPWAKKIKSYLPKKATIENPEDFESKSLIILLPERLPIFNYLYGFKLNDLKSQARHHINLDSNKVDYCLEIAPGLKGGSWWDGDKLSLSRSSPNLFIQDFKEMIKDYLDYFFGRNMPVPEKDTNQKLLEKFVIDAFKDYYAGIPLTVAE
ncbi:hypothetical protein HYX16_00455 [Candidatus Woesearchaeota archaeon]|nr:hypothetical protein [Candidatus Woesearchaeota archaeon]